MTTDVFDIEIPAGHGIMHELHPAHGDQRVMWDRGSEEEVAAARATFDTLTGKGYLAYKAEGRRGERGEVMRAFDPDAERIILVKQNQGG